MAAKTRCIKNAETGVVFVYTKALSELPGMIECDITGVPTAGAAVVEQPWAEAERLAENLEPTIDDFKALLEKMEIDELKAKANELEIEFAGNIGADTLRTRILDGVEERLNASSGADDE